MPIFSSHMVYGCQVWGQKNLLINKKLETISKLQDRAIRIINFKNWNDEPGPLYKNNHILKLQDLITTQNIMFVHDYLNNRLPSCFQDNFSKLSQLHPSLLTKNTHAGCLFVPTSKSTTYGLNSITRQSITSWNDMTGQFNTDLLQLSRYSLKSKLSQYFLSHY